jgi:hypothetical protein
MIIKWKGAEKSRGYADGGLHCNIDLAPTIAELISSADGNLNIKPGKHWDGKSYADTILHKKETGRESVVISQMAHVCQRSARFGDWLYIRTYHCGYHLFDNEMLFNIAKDPYEQDDVKGVFPEICAKGAKIILDWHDEMMRKSVESGNNMCTVDPMWTVLQEGGPAHTIGALDGYIKRLRATGRSTGADKLEKKYKK